MGGRTLLESLEAAEHTAVAAARLLLDDLDAGRDEEHSMATLRRSLGKVDALRAAIIARNTNPLVAAG